MVYNFNVGQGEFPYEWVKTKDGSLTLKHKGEKSEWMHSLHGAYSESQYIYGEALRFVFAHFKEDRSINIQSMGLGLGYLELIATFESLNLKRDIKVISYEADSLLKELFLFNCELGLSILSNNNISKNKNDSSLYTEFYSSYFSFFIKDYGLDIVREGLEQIINDSKNSNLKFLELKNELNGKTMKNENTKFHLIFYDAFSSSSQSELWENEFLEELIKNHTDESFCVLSTYAKVGELSRVLKKYNFTLVNKKGFAFKRESTFAHRIFIKTDLKK